MKFIVRNRLLYYNNIQVHANAIFFTVENVCLPNKFLSKKCSINRLSLKAIGQYSLAVNISHRVCIYRSVTGLFVRGG